MKRDQELVDYFIAETNKKFDVISEDLKEIRIDMSKFRDFKVKSLAVIGLISAFVSICFSVVAEIAISYWGSFK